VANQRFASLDGWRGISILLVLATHLLPLGPKVFRLNETTGPMGMALFFTLSGFLITNFLLHRSSVTDFLIRRLFRIIPLAWLYITIALYISSSTPDVWRAHLLFYANWPPMKLTAMTSHIWSLSVEMQFYVGIALLVRFFSKKALLFIPLICVAFTVNRYLNDVHIAINTYYRIDEILAGSVLALVYNHKLGTVARNLLTLIHPFFIFLLLIISCHPDSGWMNYFRPYLAAILVGNTLISSNSTLSRLLDNRALIYIATISYALYIIHPILLHTWLGEGDTLIKYAKRPLLFMALFALAHASTFYFELRMINVGKRLSARLIKNP